MSGVNLPSFDGQSETLYTRVSAAVRLHDPLISNGELVGAVSLQADGLIKQPIRNLSGWFVFTNLTIGSKYRLRLESEYYMPLELDIQAPASASDPPTKVEVQLLAKASYPFPGHLTLIRAIVQQPLRQPAPNAVVEALRYEPEDSSVAALAMNADSGSLKLKLTGLNLDALGTDSVLLLKDTNASKLEYVRLAAPFPEAPAAEGYPLVAPLRYSHLAGTSVYSLTDAGVYRIQTDVRGEFAIPVVGMSLSLGFVALKVTQEGYRAIHRDIQCEEGRTASIGVLTLLSI